MKYQPLLPGTINLWKVSLSRPQRAVSRLEGLLDAEEREKGRQFRFPNDRLRYVISRGALRSILAGYLDAPPAELAFSYGVYGKPFLAPPAAGQELYFNLSHCADMTLIAITSGRSIGVDVEKVGLMPDFERILQSYFSEEEREYVESAGSEGKIKTFLTLWTRREAAVKALGLDLSTALSQLSIPVYEPGRGIRLEHIGKGGWFLRDLQLGSTHVGAMCVEGESWGVVFHDFKESWEGGTSEISSIRAGACLSSS